jgi:hypothetical protein
MSIHNEPIKIKSPVKAFLDSQNGHNLMICIIILGVSVAGFSLGLASAKKDAGGQSEVTIEANPSLIVATKADYEAGTDKDPLAVAESLTAPKSGSSSAKTSNQTGNSGEATSQPAAGAFVASKKGKKYYPVGCAGAKSLSESNRIYFKDAAEAEAKGYTISTACQ